MLRIEQTKLFKKEFDLALRRGKDSTKFKKTLDILVNNINKGMEHHLLLPEKYRLHKLSGQYSGYWECHIEPDWVLIYYLNDEVLGLERTGTHSDLVNKVKR